MMKKKILIIKDHIQLSNKDQKAMIYYTSETLIVTKLHS